MQVLLVLLIINFIGLNPKLSQNCDANIRPHLYSNIALSAGSTMFPGLKERLSKELIVINRSINTWEIRELLVFINNNN
ncbi:MAG: hypothetical protein ACW99A_12790 [Candidatus Kariarchaeaceae archaeon]